GVLGTVRIPFQEMLHLGRLPVFVSAENTDIEIKARVLEVIRVAAIKSNLLFWREDEPHVVVTLETIKVIRAALIKGDDVRAQSCFFFALFFDLRDRLLACGRRLLRAHSRLQRRGDAWRY